MMICKKCGAIYTPPLNTHPKSYAAERCYDCYLEYVNVLLKCGKVKTTADDLKRAIDGTRKGDSHNVPTN